MKKSILMILGVLILSLGVVSAGYTYTSYNYTYLVGTSCTDSDGDDPKTDGTISFINSSNTDINTFTESCRTSSGSPGYSYLGEYTCVDDGSGLYNLTETRYYCDDCTTRTCGLVLAHDVSDTDGGNNSLVEGWTNYTLEIQNSDYSVLASLGYGAGYHDKCSSSYIYEYITQSGAYKYECSTAWGSAYSCISLTGPDKCGIACTDASSCSGYACKDSAYCMASCSSDSDCASGYACSSGTCVVSTISTEISCSDHFDDDLDGYTDCLDSDCDGVERCEYAAEVTCDEGLDNDGDGYYDCEDSDCSRDSACLPSCVDADCSPYMCDTGTDACKTSCSAKTDCSTGYNCKSSVCKKVPISKKAKLGAAEYDSSSSLPWILGAVGVLLIGGILYWHFKPVKKKGKKK